MLSAFNTLLRAKLVYNKNKEVYKIVAAFNVTERTERGEYKLPNKKTLLAASLVTKHLKQISNALLHK